jgi:hypothetical protein
MPVRPEIRLQFSPLVYTTIATRLFHVDKPDGSLMEPERARQKTEQYRMAWSPHEKEIVTGMCALFDLVFYKSVIDVYLSPWVPTISAPILVTLRSTPDEFIDVLTHELLHVLITDNTTYPQEVLGTVLEQLYPDLDWVAKNHVLVYAGLKHIYLNVMQEPERLDRDIVSCQSHPAHAAAWDYVDTHGYLAVIDRFKDGYNAMAKQRAV